MSEKKRKLKLGLKNLAILLFWLHFGAPKTKSTSQARINPEVFVNFRPEPDLQSPARLTTTFLIAEDMVLSNYSKNARNVIQWH